MAQKLNLYIAKKFLTNFILVSTSVALLIAMISVFELLDRVAGKSISFWQIILLDVLQVPSFIEDIASFLIMISSMITLFSLSIRSEITVMRASGLSFWQILLPIAVTAFLLGLFFTFIFNPLSISASKKLNNIEKEFIEQKKTDLLAPKNGIWLKQENILNSGEDIIIRADKVYRDDLKMVNVNLWFFNEHHKFYKRIDAQNMFLDQGYWYLRQAIINDGQNFNKPVKNLKIATSLRAEFITKKILNNFENVRLFSVYDLPILIDDLKGSGFSPRKFVVYYNALLIKPFLFTAMALMAVFFAINNVRNKNNIMFFVCGIAVGLTLYIGFVIINALGSSGLIPTFLATWVMVLILTTISILLIFKKEAIN